MGFLKLHLSVLALAAGKVFGEKNGITGEIGHANTPVPVPVSAANFPSKAACIFQSVAHNCWYPHRALKLNGDQRASPHEHICSCFQPLRLVQFCLSVPTFSFQVRKYFGCKRLNTNTYTLYSRKSTCFKLRDSQVTFKRAKSAHDYARVLARFGGTRKFLANLELLPKYKSVNIGMSLYSRTWPLMQYGFNS